MDILPDQQVFLHRQALQQQQQNDNPDHDGVDGDAAHNNINGARLR
jgi:hypothetical protein